MKYRRRAGPLSAVSGGGPVAIPEPLQMGSGYVARYASTRGNNLNRGKAIKISDQVAITDTYDGPTVCSFFSRTKPLVKFHVAPPLLWL